MTIQKQALALALSALFSLIFSPASQATASPAAENGRIETYGMKIPHETEGLQIIPAPVKELLDRDFRSRYPLAAPIKSDVLRATVEVYNVFDFPNGFGGFDTRHYFRIIAIHARGEKVAMETSLVERDEYENDQDPIVVESFRILGWAP